MTDSLGVELTPGRFRALGSASRSLLGSEHRQVAEAVGEVADSMLSVLAAHSGTRVSLGEEAERPDRDVADLLALARSRLDDLNGRLRGAERERGKDDEGALPRALSAAGHLADDVARLTNPKHTDVAWVDGDRRAPMPVSYTHLPYRACRGPSEGHARLTADKMRPPRGPSLARQLAHRSLGFVFMSELAIEAHDLTKVFAKGNVLSLIHI